MAYGHIPMGHLWHHTGLNPYHKVNLKASIQYSSGGDTADNGRTRPESKFAFVFVLLCPSLSWTSRVIDTCCPGVTGVLECRVASVICRERKHTERKMIRKGLGFETIMRIQAGG
jgi:hypothetical protein